MAAPSNTSAVTAIDIGTLPVSPAISQDVHDAGTTYTVWYKYTAVNTERVIFFFAFGDLSVYTPTTNVYLGPDTAPVAYKSIAAVNKALNIPVDGGVTYYFEIVTNSGDPNPAILTINSETAPCEGAADGDLIIPNDTPEMPMTVIDKTDGHVKGYLTKDDLGADYPSGEAGDTSNAGVFMLENGSVPGEVKLYNPDGSFWQTVNFPEVTGNNLLIRSVQTSIEWYWSVVWVGNSPANAIWYLIDPTITIVEQQSLPTAGATAVAVSFNLRYVYIAGQGSGDLIKTWDRNAFALTTSLLASYTSGFIARDMIVFSDDSIVINFWKSSTRHCILEYYSVAGNPPVLTPVFTTDLGTGWSVTDPRITHDTTLPQTTVWLMIHKDNETYFKKIRVADGVELSGFTAREYSGGAYQGAATANPPKFGVAPSCPITIKGPTPPGSPTIPTCPGSLAGVGGLYVVEPNKRNDTVWTDPLGGTTKDLKIPNPTWKTGLIGD